MASIYKIKSGWRAQVRIADKKPLSRVFSSKVEAIAWTRATEGRLHNNIQSNDHVLYSEIHDKYFAALKRCGYTKSQVCKKLLEYWKGYRLAEITTTAISDYALKRQRDGLAPATVLSELTYMGVVLQHGGVLADNQEALRAKLALKGAIMTLRNLGTVGEGRRRTRRPTEEELLRLKEHFLNRPRSQVPMWELVMFAIATCMRLGEIVGSGGVVWPDFDEDQRLLTIRSRKDPQDPAGFDMTIPLLCGHALIEGQAIDPVAIILRQQSAYQRKGRIFPFSENTVSLSFTNACKALGIDDLTFHDLRHDGISRMFVPGKYSIPEVAKVSGHKSWKNLQRYTQIRPESLHKN
jgi:integrase